MSLKKSVAIEVEARTEGAVQNIEKLANSTRKAREEVDGTGKRLAGFDAALQRAGSGGLPRAEAAMNKVGTASRALAVGLEQSKSGTLGLAQVATTAAAAFGPWGIAISVVGGTLLGLVSSQLQAADAADEHTAAIKRQEREAKSIADEESRREATERYVASVAKDDADREARRQRAAINETEAELHALDESIAEHGAGRDMEAFVARREEIRINNLFLDDAEDREARRQEKLRHISAMADGADKPSGGSSRRSSPGKPDNDFADKAAIQEWDALMDARDADRLAKKERSDLEFKTMDERFNLIMEERADKAESEERRRHDESIARIAEQKEAEEDLLARREELLSMTSELASRGVDLANMVAKAAGANAKKREKIANAAGAAEAFVIGTVEVIKAAAAAASFNIPQAVLHGAAAVLAFAKGGMMLASAGGSGGGGGVGVGGGALTGSSFGEGSTPSANERPSTSNTQKDTTPISESGLQQSGSTNSGSLSGTGKSFNFAPGSVTVLGAIDDQSATKIAQGIRRAEQSSGKLATG